MNVISRRGLMELAKAKRVDAAAMEELAAWYRLAHSAAWRGLMEVRKDFPSADQVGRALIFNIRHNRYRLITFVIYSRQKVYVKALLNHKEYEREEWRKWA